MSRRRLDAELVRRGIATSRAAAADLIARGDVLVDGFPVRKPASLVHPASAVVVAGPGRRFVSRGGDKLDAALGDLHLDVAGRRAVDVGASTGGFTDCLLQRGARAVVAIDVGYGQLAEAVRRDARVTVYDRLHVRDASAEGIGGAADVVVADLSFISLATVAPALARLGTYDADWVLLVKPQFEAGRAAVGRTGVVQDPGVWHVTLTSVIAALARAGLGVIAVMPSRLPGTKGNKEFFVHARRGPVTVTPEHVHQAADTAQQL